MRRPFLPVLTAIALSACGSDIADGSGDGEAGRDAGTYEVDAETGETRASITTEDGTTTMVAGENVAADLPDGFTLYPGAEVISTINIGRGKGQGVMLSFASDDPSEDLVAFYRKQAEEAGVKIEMVLETGRMTMIGGEGPGNTQMTFQTDSEGSRTTGQLTVSRGLN